MSITSLKVDRSKKVEYPRYLLKEVVHSEFEYSGPAEFTLDQLELHTPQDFENIEIVSGSVLYNFLTFNQEIFKRCLNLQDLYAILERGPSPFQDKVSNHWAWKSMIKGSDNALYVPYLDKKNQKIGWTAFELFHNLKPSFLLCNA
jgi:hypothetical protein